MHETALTPWANFYVIIGSSAAVLIGLMFVVITLLTGARARRPGMGIAAFSTPTIVHYCVALAVAAIISAPWQVLWHAGLLIGAAGIGGLAYSGVVVRRMRGQADYRPVLEDWLWHLVFPVIAYMALVVAALFLTGNPATVLFIVGAATVLLLFVGIHNAWDNVIYLVIEFIHPPVEDPDEGRQVNASSEGHAPAFDGGEGAKTATASFAGAPGDPGRSGAGEAPRDASSGRAGGTRAMSQNRASHASSTSSAWPASRRAIRMKR